MQKIRPSHTTFYADTIRDIAELSGLRPAVTNEVVLFDDSAQAERNGMVAVDPNVLLKAKGMTRKERRAWVAQRKRERRAVKKRARA